MSLCQPVLGSLGIMWHSGAAPSSLSCSLSRLTLLPFLPDSSRFPKVSGPSHPSLTKLRVKKGFSGLGVGHLKDAIKAVTPHDRLSRGVKANPARLKRLKK